MRGMPISLTMLVLGLIITASVPPGGAVLTTSGASQAHSAPGTTSYAAHPPILITGRDQFTAANGVSAGAGTLADPYVIERWSINASSAAGIRIALAGVSADPVYVAIRNLSVTSGGSQFAGVSLEGLAAGRVENVTLADNWIGLNMNLYGSAYSESTVKDSLMVRNGWYGIWIVGSPSARVEGNVMEENGVGMTVERSGKVVVTRNLIARNHGHGIASYNNGNLQVYGNNLVGNFQNAYDGTVPPGASWDAGYSLGGNYWSDYGGLDRCGGEAQQNCSLPDGIGDTGYSIQFETGVDRYPRIGAAPGVPRNPDVTVEVGQIAYVGDPTHLDVVVASDAPVTSVFVWFRDPGSADFRGVNMTRLSPGEFETILPAAGSSGDLDFFVMVTDSSGLVMRSPDLRTYTVMVKSSLENPSSFLLPLIVAVSVALIAVVVVLYIRHRRATPRRP